MKYKFWYRRTAAFLSLVLFWGIFSLPASAEENVASVSETETVLDSEWPLGPDIVGESGILMEVSTGTILYSKNVHQQYYPASITKIMTALLVLENCDLDEWVTIPHEAVYMDEDKGSHIALDEGEEVRVEDLLYALMLASANDAAYALAVHTGGSIEGFAAMMNAKAEELGCRDSHFVNPHGLPNEEHLTSAYDMALITREALQSEVFRRIAGTLFYEIPPSEKQPDLIPMSQHHDMLTGTRYHYDGAFVGKTGYTTIAKNTLVTCAGRDGMELICVTMKTEGKQVYKDTAALFDFGFEQFRKLDIASNLAESVNLDVYADAVANGENMEIPDDASVPMETSLQIPLRLTDNANVVIPAGRTFGELKAELHYDILDCSETSKCLITFEYADRKVGRVGAALPAQLVVTEGTDAAVTDEGDADVEAAADDTDRNEKESSSEKGFRWWYILIGLLILSVIAGIGFFVVRRIIWQRRWKKRRRRGRMPGYSTRRSDRRY